MTKIITINLSPIKEYLMSFRPIATLVSLCKRLAAFTVELVMSTVVLVVVAYLNIKNDLKNIWK